MVVEKETTRVEITHSETTENSFRKRGKAGRAAVIVGRRV